MPEIVGQWLYGPYKSKVEGWEPVGQVGEMQANSQLDATHRFVTVTAAGPAARAGANALVVGVGFAQRPASVETGAIESRTAAGPMPVGVQLTGVARLVVGGAAVALGAQLKSDAQGRGVPADTDGDNVGGVALQAGLTGETIDVLLTPGTVYSA